MSFFFGLSNNLSTYNKVLDKSSRYNYLKRKKIIFFKSCGSTNPRHLPSVSTQLYTSITTSSNFDLQNRW